MLPHITPAVVLL